MGCVVVVLFCFLISLGTWQRNRGHEKTALLQAQASAQQTDFITIDMLLNHPIDIIRYRKIHLYGRFIPQADFLLDNQTLQGKVGYHVLSAFEINNGGTVLIHRGWVAAPVHRNELPHIPSIPGEITIEGIVEKGYVNPLISRTLENNRIEWPLRVQNIDFELFSKLLNRSITDKMIVLSRPIDSSFTALPPSSEWLTPERHFGYAFQWYSLAAVLLLLSMLTLWRTYRHEQQSKHHTG